MSLRVRPGPYSIVQLFATCIEVLRVSVPGACLPVDPAWRCGVVDVAKKGNPHIRYHERR